jgi:hypothetical protein
MATLSRTFLNNFDSYRANIDEVTDWLTIHVGERLTNSHKESDNDNTKAYSYLGGMHTPTKYMDIRYGDGWAIVFGNVVKTTETPTSTQYHMIKELLVRMDDDHKALQLKLAYF